MVQMRSLRSKSTFRTVGHLTNAAWKMIAQHLIPYLISCYKQTPSHISDITVTF